MRRITLVDECWYLYRLILFIVKCKKLEGNRDVE